VRAPCRRNRKGRESDGVAIPPTFASSFNDRALRVPSRRARTLPGLIYFPPRETAVPLRGKDLLSFEVGFAVRQTNLSVGLYLDGSCNIIIVAMAASLLPIRHRETLHKTFIGNAYFVSCSLGRIRCVQSIAPLPFVHNSRIFRIIPSILNVLMKFGNSEIQLTYRHSPPSIIQLLSLSFVPKLVRALHIGFNTCRCF
jgi:hypothetical protein